MKKQFTKITTASKDQTWETPRWLFNALNLRFAFTLDPCCFPETAKTPRFFTPEQNGLKQSWKGERVFCNPPYNEIPTWLIKARDEAAGGALVVMLIPARTHRKWWRDHALHGAIELLPALNFEKGGVAGLPAPFAPALVIFGGEGKPGEYKHSELMPPRRASLTPAFS